MLSVALAGPLHAQPIDLLATPGSAMLPEPNMVDFEDGLVEYAGAIELVVAPRNTNKTWFLFVRTDDLDLGGYGKPIDDLVWRIRDGSWNAVDSSYEFVESGTGNGSVFVEIALFLRWDRDLPDIYGGDLVFHVSHSATP